MLSALDRERAAAVFFLAGEQVSMYPELVSEIVAAGHEIGLHCYRHRPFLQWSPRRLEDDVHRGVDALVSAGAPPPRLYRPPYGVFSLVGLRRIRNLGLQPLLWSRWGRDWQRDATPTSIAERATAGIRAGDVVLLHDADHYSVPGSWRATAAAVPRILERLAAAGLSATLP